MNELSVTFQNDSIGKCSSHLPDHLVRQYDDGPDWPTTKERQTAERAYRDAFLLSAR